MARDPDGAADHLRVLGLPPDTGWEAVQARYRQLVLTHHPDLNPHDAAAGERFRRVSASYSALCTLRQAAQESAAQSLQMLCSDPRLRALDEGELGLRLRHSNSPRVREAAAFLLGRPTRHGGEGMARLLLRAARRDPQAQVRRAAVDSLTLIGRLGDLSRFALCAAARRGLGAGVLLRAAIAIGRRNIRAAAVRLGRAAGISR